MTATTVIEMKDGKNKQKLSTLDDIIDGIGIGPWNYLIFIAAMLNVSAYAINLVVGQFSAPYVSFSCLDSETDPNIEALAETQCFVNHRVNGSDFESRPCQKFNFDISIYDSTVTSKFGLVCDRSYLVSLYQVLATLGFSTGSIFGGTLNEKFGRGRTFYFIIILQNVAILMNIFSPWISLVLLGRFIEGFCGCIATNASYTLALECCPQKSRPTFGTVFSLPYAMIIIFLGIFAYFVRDWQIITGVMYIPIYLLLVLGNPWIIDESPRWLLSNNRLVETERVIQRACKMNGKTDILPDDLGALIYNLYKRDFESEEVTIWSRFKSLLTAKDMRILVIQEGIIWFLLGILYACIPLSVGDFGSPFIAMSLLGLSEVPAYSLVAPVTARLGRRIVISGGLAIAGMLFLVDVGIRLSLPWLDADVSDLVHIGMAAVTCMFICTSWQVSNTHRIELFPTTVRSVASTVTYSMAGLGCSVPPVIDSVMEGLPSNLHWTKQVMYAILCFALIFIVLRLKETKNKPLSPSVGDYTHEKNQDKLDRYNKKITKILNNIDPKYLAKMESEMRQYENKILEGDAVVDESAIIPGPPVVFTIDTEMSNERTI